MIIIVLHVSKTYINSNNKYNKDIVSTNMYLNVNKIHLIIGMRSRTRLSGRCC